jgi:hypothetical protein
MIVLFAFTVFGWWLSGTCGVVCRCGSSRDGVASVHYYSMHLPDEFDEDEVKANCFSHLICGTGCIVQASVVVCTGG